MQTWSQILSILFAAAFGSHTHADASMVAQRGIPVAKVIEHFEKSGNKDALAFARLDRDVLGANAFYFADQGSDEAVLANLQPADIAYQVADHIRSLQDWGKPAPAAAVAGMKANRAVLEKQLAGARNADVWPWVLNQLGEKAQARELLAKRFNEESEQVLKLKEAVSGLGHTPLGEAEYLFRALKAVASPDEMRGFEDKMQKMKVHVSNLPQSVIMTKREVDENSGRLSTHS